MLIKCKYCKSKFAIDAEEVGFDGRLVKCSHCHKEWFQESKAQILEKKLIELDRNLHATELHLIEKKNSHNNKIRNLEKALKTKKEELEKQKKLEDRISLFQKRVHDTEREMESQNLVEERIVKLEKQIQKNSFDSFVKNTNLEKKTDELQNKIYAEDVEDKLEDLEKLEKEVQDKTAEISTNDIKLEKITNELGKKISSYNNTNDKLGELEQEVVQIKKENKIIENQTDDEIVNNSKSSKHSFFSPKLGEELANEKNKKSNKFFFWEKKVTNTADTGELVRDYFRKKKENSSNQDVKIGSSYKVKDFDLSQEAIDRELNQLKKNKKK